MAFVKIKIFLSLIDGDPIITSLFKLGEGEITKVLVDDQLPSDVRPLGNFTCLAYSNTSSSPDSIPALRPYLFHTKNYEGVDFPPT